METVYNSIRKVEYHAEILISNLFPENLRANEDFLTRSSGLLTRRCPPSDQLGDTEILLQLSLRRAEIVYRLDRLMSRREMQEFFYHYFQRLTDLLQDFCIGTILKITLQGFTEIHAVVEYNQDIQNAIDFFVSHPNRADIVDNFERLTNFRYTIAARSRSSFEFLITIDDWRVSECHMTTRGGCLIIKTNFQDVILMLHNFYQAVRQLKRNMSMEHSFKL